MSLESASPNFNLDKVLGKNLVVDIQVVAPQQPSALRVVLLASRLVSLEPVVECDHQFRDDTWAYLKKKFLTDFVKELVFYDNYTGGVHVGLPPSHIVVERITFDNMYQLANKVLTLK